MHSRSKRSDQNHTQLAASSRANAIAMPYQGSEYDDEGLDSVDNNLNENDSLSVNRRKMQRRAANRRSAQLSRARKKLVSVSLQYFLLSLLYMFFIFMLLLTIFILFYSFMPSLSFHHSLPLSPSVIVIV